MAFSDLCKISNAYKTVENESDQSERIMEENSMVQDLITKILDETGPTEGHSLLQPPDKTLGLAMPPNSQFPKNDTNTSFLPPTSYNNFQDMFNFNQNEPNSFNYSIQNGFGNTNGFVNFPENDVSNLLGIDQVDSDAVSPEQLNLLRLAAQEIGGAQFTSPTPKYDDKYYNFFEPSQRNSLPETNMFPTNNFNRPQSVNLDLNFTSNGIESNPFNASTANNMQQYPTKYADSFLKDSQNTQETADIISYLNQLNLLDRPREDGMMQNMPMESNGHYPIDEKMFNFNRNFQQPPPKTFNGENFYLNEMMKSMSNEKNFPPNQNYDFQPPHNFKPNGFHHNEFMQRRDMNQMQRENGNFPNGPINEPRIFDNQLRDNVQQQAMMRQNQELARQMSLLMRNRPPPNPLNVDVSFLHENAPFNLGLNALLGPNPSVPPPVLPSPMMDLPLLAPYNAMRNMRKTAQTSSSILHARLDACYEQWRQLERERKRTEARLALAYPGRAVSSCNSIPVPRLPPAPTRVDRLTVDMLREHTKVLTLMGKMETLRASVCVSQNKKPNKEDSKITVLKRGQENVASDGERDGAGVDPATFDPKSWREELSLKAEIAPHSEVESAMLAWRSAVASVQAARRNTLPQQSNRHCNTDPILQLADAVKQLSSMARRARCAMWCDLTLTVALAPRPSPAPEPACKNDKQQTSSPAAAKPTLAEPSTNSTPNGTTAKPANSDTKEEKPNASTKNADDPKPTEPNNNKPSTANNNTKPPVEKQEQKSNQQRRTQNYRHKLNQGRSNDFYQKNQRYDTRFMQNRHPYHYLATGPIN